MAEFEVIYPDSKAIYDLSATPTTKSTINSAGLEITDGTSTATLSNSTLELAVSGGMSSFSSSLGVDLSGFTMNEAQLTMDYAAAGMAPAITTTTGSGGFLNINQDTNEQAKLDSLGVHIYNGGATLSNIATYSSSIITGASGAVSTVDASQLKVESSALETVITPASVALGIPAGASVSLSSADGVSIQSGPFQPDELLDVSGNNGLDGQYLISNGTAPVWTTVSAPATPNLASVLAVATAGDADNQPISNLSSLGFEATTGGQAVLAITAKASSKPAATFDVMNLPYAADATTGRVFSNQYVEISVAGTSYWVQLFSAPPV